MSLRARRLQADFEKVEEVLLHHPAIAIRTVTGSPPDRYQIVYSLRSLVEGVDGKISERTEHVAEFYLTLGFPRQAPQCRMLTPVFHPNIAPHAVCIGDHWAAGESLLQLIVRVGEMLAYQSYNIKSPLNGAAARWAEENLGQLPTDSRDLTPGPALVAAPLPSKDMPGCPGCHQSRSDLHRCVKDHQACPDCLVQCHGCNDVFCQQCGLSTCVICGRLLCDSCRTTCPQCQRSAVCSVHMVTCDTCGRPGCPDCCLACAQCGRRVCLTDVGKCAHCDEYVCRAHLLSCSGCQASLCTNHAQRCDICGAESCPDCTFQCHNCGRQLCLEHVAQCAECRSVLCSDHRTICRNCGRSYCAAHLKSDEGVCGKCATNRPAIAAPVR